MVLFIKDKCVVFTNDKPFCLLATGTQNTFNSFYKLERLETTKPELPSYLIETRKILDLNMETLN